ncbi:DEDD exonuclease domain-containing protein [Actinomyces vulturis]|uniref:DEDD exonuclease domain-containing protein n=1 Tax=Actinomyces vulturis TaxID=1857645 RepID=UPI0008353B22|nr:DEDD exonuclease domain-containing protein [Actinomyces vulturis]
MAHQASFDEMGTPLHDALFIVVDLETTGGPPGDDAITEIGAVAVQGGEILSTFSELCNPHAVIPARISLLTGITNAMVSRATDLRAVMGEFLEWMRQLSTGEPTTVLSGQWATRGVQEKPLVLVAHNARFDVGHLRAACEAFGLEWPAPPVVDTLILARKVWDRTLTPNHKLGTLARLVGSPTTPTHRALDDAKATVDVLHAALAELGSRGVTHVEDIARAQDRVAPAIRSKSPLARDLPQEPGVYEFIAATGEVLYVGSSHNLRQRVRTYFTAGEKRRRVKQIIPVTSRIDHRTFPTVIEARVHEVRRIAEADPVANRQSKRPTTTTWIRFVEYGSSVRLSTATTVQIQDLGGVIGPFMKRSAAQSARRLIEAAALEASKNTANASSLTYRDNVIRGACEGKAILVVEPTMARMAKLSQKERYEDAQLWLQRLQMYLHGAVRAEHLRTLLSIPHLVAARRRESGGWEFIVVRFGRLVASGVSDPGADPRPVVEELCANAAVEDPPLRVGWPTTTEETLLLSSWIWQEGTRLVSVCNHADSQGVIGECLPDVGTMNLDSACAYLSLLSPK